MKQKQRVAVDLDDTLAATIEGTLAFVSRRLGKKFEKGDITSLEYWAAYGISDTDAIELVHAYNLEGFPGLQPIQGAYQTLLSLRDKYIFYIITAREATTAETTRQWINTHFPGIFEDVIFAGNPYVNKEARSKETICQELGVSILIDDSLSHTRACAGMGMGVVLFGGHAWHLQDTEENQLVARASDWDHVKEYFDAKG